MWSCFVTRPRLLTVSNPTGRARATTQTANICFHDREIHAAESARRQNRSHTGAASGIGRLRSALRPRRRSRCPTDIKTGRACCRCRDHEQGGRAIFEPGDVTSAADCQRVTERSVRDPAVSTSCSTAHLRRASVVELSETDGTGDGGQRRPFSNVPPGHPHNVGGGRASTPRPAGACRRPRAAVPAQRWSC